LVVSGDGQTADELCRALGKRRFRADAAVSMEQALEKIDRQVPSLIIADFQLADGSGPEFIQRLRTMPRTSRLPVLLLGTAFQAEHYRSQLGPEGPQDWLRKPVDEASLTRGVQQWIGVRLRNPAAPTEPEPHATPNLAQEGSFAELPFARLLVLAGRRKAGSLLVQRNDQWLRIWLEGETIVGVASSYISGTSLGRMLVLGGRIDGVTLSEAQVAIDEGRRLGEWLIENNLLEQAELEDYLRRQMVEKLVALFSWRWYDADWSYQPDAPTDAIQVSGHLPIKQLIFRGIMNHYDRDRLEMIFTKRRRLNRPVIPTTPYTDDLPIGARRLLQAADGRAISANVRARAGMEVMRFYQVLYALWVLDLVRFGDPVDTTPDAGRLEDETFLKAKESVGKRR
jgi:CheY-like chemotaxis protein